MSRQEFNVRLPRRLIEVMQQVARLCYPKRERGGVQRWTTQALLGEITRLSAIADFQNLFEATYGRRIDATELEEACKHKHNAMRGGRSHRLKRKT